MGLFDFLKKKNTAEPPIPENDKKYYQPDSYYVGITHPGTTFERKVITFQERKSISFPSKRGLYVAEILLLEYCSYGTYPHPKNGYPGFWWFEYGIRNVGYYLSELERRGFIFMDSKGKYRLTELGESELEENEYVPFMHKTKDKTTEDKRFGPALNVWEVNRRLKNGEAKNWRRIIEDIQRERSKYQRSQKIQHEKILKDMESWAPEQATEIRKIDKRLAGSERELQAAKDAELQYKESGDINSYIAFWEKVWSAGGPKTLGSRWTFTLPDLYIKQKCYDDALRILKKINNPVYQDKKRSYITKIQAAKKKAPK